MTTGRAADAFAATDRIAGLEVDTGGLQAATPELEQERRVAEFEILEENRFRLTEEGAEGPYRAAVSLAGGGARIDVLDQGGRAAALSFATPEIETAVEEYRVLCESYMRAVRDLAPSQIEQLDAERRAAHVEGAEAVLAALAGRAETDLATARRLFSLVVVLTPAAH